MNRANSSTTIVRKSPCRGCTGQIKIAIKDFRSLSVAAKRAEDLAEDLKATRKIIHALKDEVAGLRLDAALKPHGENVTLHRSYGEPWVVCWREACGCEELEKEHATFGRLEMR